MQRTITSAALPKPHKGQINQQAPKRKTKHCLGGKLYTKTRDGKDSSQVVIEDKQTVRELESDQ